MEQAGCTPVFRQGDRQVVLAYSGSGLVLLPYYRLGAGRVYSRIPGRDQAGCTPVFQAGGRQAVLPYSRQGTGRLYSRIQAGGRQVVLPYSRRGADRQAVLPYFRQGQAGCTPVMQAGCISGRGHATSID